MPHVGRQLRNAMGVLLAGMVLVLTDAGFPSRASGTDWTHLNPGVPEGAIAKPSVVWLPSPNYDARPEGTAIDMIVIHDTESPGVRDVKTIWHHFACVARTMRGEIIARKRRTGGDRAGHLARR